MLSDSYFFLSTDAKIIRQESIGNSLGGIPIPILKITNPAFQKMVTYTEKKRTIVVIGRQHSGETHSSFIIHGLINFLMKRDLFSHQLRELFEWWILPMVNPDGVIVGNYRSNL